MSLSSDQKIIDGLAMLTIGLDEKAKTWKRRGANATISYFYKETIKKLRTMEVYLQGVQSLEDAHNHEVRQDGIN